MRSKPNFLSNRRLRRSTALGSAVALICAGAQAAVVVDIDFSEVPLLTSDPTIEGVAFSAGNPAIFEDTFTDDFVNPTDPYLVSGIEGSGAVDLPGFNSTAFINAALAAQGGAGKTTKVTLDAGFFAPLPSGETIRVQALLGGVVQGTAELTTATAYDPANPGKLLIDLGPLSFDALQIFVPSDFGSVFLIDNLLVDVTGGQLPPIPPVPPCSSPKNASGVTGDTCLDGSSLTFDAAGLDVPYLVELRAGGGTMVTNQFDGSVSGAIWGAGGLTKTGAGTLTLMGMNTFTGATLIQAGTLVVAAGGSLEGTSDTRIAGGTLVVDGSVGSTVYVGPGSFLRGTGTIGGTTTVAGTLAPGNSPGTLTFTAPLIMNGGTLQIAIDGPGTGNGAGNYSRVLVEGAGNTFTAAGTLAPQLRGITGAANNNYNPSIGDSFTVVQAAGGVTGSFAALTQPVGLPTGTRFDALYDASAVQLALTPADYADLPNIALTGNAGSVGGAIQSARPEAYAPKDALFTSLALLDEQSLAVVLGQMGGEIHADMISAGFNTHRLNRQTVVGRLDDLRLGRETPSMTGQSDPNQHFWIQGSGGWLDADGDKNGAGFDESLYGVMGGFDMPIDETLRLGVAIGYAHNKVEADSNMGSGNADTVQLIGYGLWEQGEYFANFAIGYGWDSYDTNRRIDFGQVSVLKSDADGYSAFLDVEGGLRIQQDDYYIEPTLGLRGDILHRDGFNEKGGIGALSVKGDSYQALQTRLGAKVERSIDLEGGQTLTPELRAYWLHDFGDAIASSSKATLAGQTFSVDSTDIGRDAMVLGLGLRMNTSENVALFIDYDFTYRSEQTGSDLWAGFQMRW